MRVKIVLVTISASAHFYNARMSIRFRRIVKQRSPGGLQAIEASWHWKSVTDTRVA